MFQPADEAGFEPPVEPSVAMSSRAAIPAHAEAISPATSPAVIVVAAMVPQAVVVMVLIHRSAPLGSSKAAFGPLRPNSAYVSRAAAAN
jgi:hypothetical protein